MALTKTLKHDFPVHGLMLRFALRFPGFGDLRSSRSLASLLHGSSTHVLIQS